MKEGDFMKLKIDKEEYINKTFRLSRNLVFEMDKVCDAKNISLNKLVHIFIRFALENYDRDDEENKKKNNRKDD